MYKCRTYYNGSYIATDRSSMYLATISLSLSLHLVSFRYEQRILKNLRNIAVHANVICILRVKFYVTLKWQQLSILHCTHTLLSVFNLHELSNNFFQRFKSFQSQFNTSFIMSIRTKREREKREKANGRAYENGNKILHSLS